MTYHVGNQLIDPERVLEKAQLQPGMHVADFGCGRTGHLVFPSARVVGEQGIVYAVDIVPDVLENIAKRTRSDAIHNVHTVWSDIEHLGATAIPERSLDVIFLVNTLVHVKDRETVLRESTRLLKEKGRLVIVDWSTRGLPFSPPEAKFVDFPTMINSAKQQHFFLQEEFVAGKYHHGVVLYIHT